MTKATLFSASALKAEQKQNGMFHTPPELARHIATYLPDNIEEVYDPAAGAGALLAAFPDHVRKYGQEIMPEAAQVAAALTNAHIEVGDTLEQDKFPGRKFPGIVANPPFSVKWRGTADPLFDERWEGVPCFPPPSKGDYAWLIHILSHLTPDGTAAVLMFPGILYRGQKEGVLREWLCRGGHIERVEHIPPDTFADTTIATTLLVMRKERAERSITFADKHTGKEHTATLEEVEANDFTLSPNIYLPREEEAREPFDEVAVETERREHFEKQLRAHITYTRMLHEAFLPHLPTDRHFENLAKIIANAQNAQATRIFCRCKLVLRHT